MRERMQSKHWAWAPWRGLGHRTGTARGRGRGEGVGSLGRASRAPWPVGAPVHGWVCFSRVLTEVSGRGAGQMASVVGQQPHPRTSRRARRSPPAGGSLLLGGTRSPSVSSRCTNLYSVMTGLESDPPSSSTPRFRDPSSPCMGKDRMKLLRAQELAVTNSGAGRVEHRMMAVHERLVSGPAAPRSTAFRHGPASQLQSPDRSLGLGAAAGGRQLRTGGCLGPRRTHRQAVG